MTPLAVQRNLAYRVRRLGWQGVAGAGLLIVALVYAAIVFPAANARRDQLLAQIAASEEQLEKANQEPLAGRPLAPAEQLQAFYEAFPKGATIPDWLEKIYAIADEGKLALDVGEYSLMRAQSGRLDQFRITFPLKATYPQLRKFIAEALATAPALSLEGLYLKRDKVADGVVDARLVFLLHLEKAR